MTEKGGMWAKFNAPSRHFSRVAILYRAGLTEIFEAGGFIELYDKRALKTFPDLNAVPCGAEHIRKPHTPAQ